jgi:tRNA pseudouridine38-40 synthase
MVRNITGLLLAVGTGESPPARVASVLAGRDRTASAATAPADGLYLATVRYPAELGLPVAQPAAVVLPQSVIIARSLS